MTRRILLSVFLSAVCAIVYAQRTDATLFYLSGETTSADFSAGPANPNFLERVSVVEDGSVGKAIRAHYRNTYAYLAPGNIYSEKVEEIDVHMYGPHIFHTDKEEVWEYVNRFARFNHFTYCPVANYKGELYNLPFNMNTFTKMWTDVKTPEQAAE